jgi:hypothetical protein
MANEYGLDYGIEYAEIYDSEDDVAFYEKTACIHVTPSYQIVSSYTDFIKTSHLVDVVIFEMKIDILEILSGGPEAALTDITQDDFF